MFFVLALSAGLGCNDDVKENSTPDAGKPDSEQDQGVRDGQPGKPDIAHDQEIKDGQPDTVLDQKINDGQPDTVHDSSWDTQVTDMGLSPIPNTLGFNIRVPQIRTVPCPNVPSSPGDLVQKDVDWICTFNHGGEQGYVYIQSNVVDCVVIMSATGVFETQGAYFSSQGVITPLQNTQYYWGGNHHNDWLEFDRSGNAFRYYHSSFGSGWRACQPMDCLQVYQSQGGAILEDGCTSDRTLPTVCLQVEEGKSYGPANFVDNFDKCLGDPSR